MSWQTDWWKTKVKGNNMNEIEFLMYEADEKIEVIVKDETIWATQKAIAGLFDVGVPAISKHLKNIFESGELDEKVVVSILENTTQHGAIQGKTVFGQDYFRELLETVRSIRASERRIWQQITDIFAEISYDYDKNSETTKMFYAEVQNKFHFAITGKTAVEIVYDKADRKKEHMGLTTWKHSPKGRILQSDVAVAKNYLTEKKIKSLERNVSSYFDYVERLLEEETLLSMEDFATSMDEFLRFNHYDILQGRGHISHKAAKQKAIEEYKEFNKHQIIDSDFDKEIRKIQGGMYE